MKTHHRFVPLFGLLAALSSGFLFAETGQWKNAGPEGASILALAVDPSDPATVYAGTNRRVYKSVDGGAHWARTGLDVPSNLVLTTRDPAIVYAMWVGTGSAYFYRTTDGGATWVRRTGLSNTVVTAVVDPTNPRTVYVATQGGFHRTTAAGDGWERIGSPPLGVTIRDLAVDPGDSDVFYGAASFGTRPGVYRSSNQGRTWSRTDLGRSAHGLVFDPSDRNRLYALTEQGLFVTTNRGERWENLGLHLIEFGFLSALVIDPNDSNRLYFVANGTLVRSLDGGRSASSVPIGGPLGLQISAIAFTGASSLVAGSNRGGHRSDDLGRTWVPANSGFRDVVVHSLAVAPDDPAVVFAGADTQGLYVSRDGGASWDESIPGTPAARVIAIDPSSPSTMYAGSSGGLSKSIDGGATWTPNPGLTESIYSLVIDPNNPRRILAGSSSLYRSGDAGGSWEAVLTPDEDSSVFYYYPPTVNAVAVAPANTSIVYAGGWGDGTFLYRSDDSGSSWTNPGPLAPFVRSLAVDACNPSILHAGAFQGVLRSSDAGATWEHRGLGGFVSAIVQDPRSPASLFAGTSEGLFWTNDYGTTWASFSPELTDNVASIAFDSSGRFLHVGTEAGVYSLERDLAPCVGGVDRFCLIRAKYQVSVTARDPRTGSIITGRAISEGDGFGYFSFPDVTGDPEFPEVFVKMTDATGAPAPYGGHVWVFHSALTDLDYRVTVREVDTGRIRIYEAADQQSLTCGRADTAAFVGACSAQGAPAIASGTRLAAASGGELSLLNGRFRATLEATDPRTGRTAEATALPRADGFGYFSLPVFTNDPTFPEVFVKMTDATALPGGHFWVFHTGLTDLAYTLTVTDQSTGATRTYERRTPPGPALCGESDTRAF